MTKPKATVSLSPRAPNIEWAKNPSWTWALISYLTFRSDFRQKLFSDADVAKEKRAGKDTKTRQYSVLAKAIFSKDPAQADGFEANPQRYATSVETRLRRLKKEYAEHLNTLVAAGIRLVPDEVTPDTPLASLVADIREKWPWWAELHAFWRELPNYNPTLAANSTPHHSTFGTGVGDDAACGQNVESEHDKDGIDDLTLFSLGSASGVGKQY